MKNKFRYIIVFIALALLAAIVAWRYTFRKTESSVASQKADYTLEVSDLLEAFERNETEANALYLDKVLLVSGNVASVSSDSLGFSVYLKQGETLSGVICSFDKEAIDTSRIKIGSSLSIKGQCTGYLMDVVLNKCSLESGPD
jgi:hypothetical protein